MERCRQGMDPQDAIFDRLVGHHQRQGRLKRLGPDSGHAILTRRAFIRYGADAVGLFEIQTLAVTDDRAVKRQITWTRNAGTSATCQPPRGEEAGSRMSSIETWGKALIEIGELPPLP